MIKSTVKTIKPIKTILIVDDEPRTRQGIKLSLEAWSAGQHRIMTANNGVEALECLRQEPVHLLITDVRMPEVSGLDVMAAASKLQRRPMIVVVSGYADFEYAQQALRLGAMNYLLKPLDKAELLDVVQTALERETEEERLERLTHLVDPKLLEADRSAVGEPVREAMRLVEEQLADPLTMAEIAARLHLNVSYFSVLFKERTGLPFSEYVSRLRIQRAKEMLVGTQLPICEIGERVGYKTDKYFIKVFKDMEGVSPSRYRKKMSGQPDEIA
ncbi:response regulator [Paenibacillus spiritus]|uniref:Response regulator n=1 Tax=Paenibacillus spiritus TaxID=2496557 RepID=A0A5J5GIM1_9BACL|nr:MULTISPECIES: response regulator [Paenibacillus]KAA9007573.1 response regulator [Paenibacillus spiritus]